MSIAPLVICSWSWIASRDIARPARASGATTRPMMVRIVAKAARALRPPILATYRRWRGKKTVANTAAQNTGMRKLAMRARNASVVTETRMKNETFRIAAARGVDVGRLGCSDNEPVGGRRDVPMRQSYALMGGRPGRDLRRRWARREAPLPAAEGRQRGDRRHDLVRLHRLSQMNV